MPLSKKNKDWENVCIIANSVVSNRQARFATKAYLKRHLRMALNEAEERALASTQPQASQQVTHVVEMMEKMSPTEQTDFVSRAEEISDKTV